jgi:hypothetical protein
LDFAHLPLFFFCELTQYGCPSSAKNHLVPAIPDHPEDITDPLEPIYRSEPVNQEHDRQVSGDEIVMQNDTRIQVAGHKSSFWVVIIHGRISMNKIIKLYI